jgi:2-aminoadipate transaminase
MKTQRRAVALAAASPSSSSSAEGGRTMDPRIERIQRRCAAKPGVLGLAGGLPAEELFPRGTLAEAFVSAVLRPSSGALQYGWPEGNQGVRSWIAARLSARGARVSADDVIVTSGAQQALAICAEVLGLAGARVGVDRETYPGALEMLRAKGARTVACEASTPTALGELACVYVVPGASNPRGLGLSAARREALLASGRPIVADEAYAELRFDGAAPRPLLADAPDRVFHVGTFSKTLCPGLRVGWLVPPRALRGEALRAKRDGDLQAGSLAQAVLEAYLSVADFDEHLERARATYASRVERLAGALRRELAGYRFVDPEGGFTVFVESDREDVDEARALSIAAAHGVSFDPASMFRADGARAPFGMRLSGSSLPEASIDEAVARLARALREVR